jgi:hypothetical protein
MALIDLTPKIEYKIPIYPNPKDGSYEAFIFFESAVHKAEHVKVEYQYCMDEYRSYSAAMNKDARAKAFAVLCGARVSYARSIGYGPSRIDPKRWVKQPPAPKTVPPINPRQA